MEKMKKQTPEPKIVGVDLHPDSFSAVLIRGAHLSDYKVERNYTCFPSSDWRKFVFKLPSGCVIVCEAGANSFELMNQARAAGHRTVVLNSISAGQIGKAYLKNDPKDALRSAKIYLSGLADEVWQPDLDTISLREILSSYENSKKDLTRCNNRFKSYLSEHNIRLKANIRLKESLYHEVLKKYSWNVQQQFLLEQLYRDWEYASNQRRRFHQMIARTVLANPLMAKLMNLCGLRLVSSFALVAAIGDINRFDRPKKLVADLGLAPSVHQSGNHKANGPLQKGGQIHLKALLIEAAHSVLKSKNAAGAVLKKWGLALMKRRNKLVAAAAIARKLAVAVWYAMKGFLPDILEGEEIIRGKLRKIASELTQAVIKTLGYNTVGDFIDEYAILLLSRSPEAAERWKQRNFSIFPTLNP